MGSANNENTYKVILNKIINNQIIKDSELSSKIFTSFIFIGILTKLFFNSFNIHDPDEGSYGSASISIWSYGIILFSIFCIVFFNSVTNINDDSTINSMTSNLSKNIPMLVLIFYLFWLISIYSKHFKKINQLKTPPNFSTFSYLTSIILLFQVLFFVFNNINNNSDNKDSNNDILEKINFLNYILITINFVLILIQQLILDNFSVDIL